MITCIYPNGREVKLRHAVVDVLMVNQKKEICLLRRTMKRSSGAGKLCLPGGYIDMNETVTEAAQREVHEETGYEIDGLILFKIRDNNTLEAYSNDNQNISFIFMGVAGKQTGIPDNEADSLAWHSLDKLPDQSEIAFDHAHIILEYKKWMSEQFTLPFFGNLAV